MKRLLLAACVILAGFSLTPAPSAQVVPAELRASVRDWLFEALRTAPTEEIGGTIEERIWQYWMRQALFGT